MGFFGRIKHKAKMRGYTRKTRKPGYWDDTPAAVKHRVDLYQNTFNPRPKRRKGKR